MSSSVSTVPPVSSSPKPKPKVPARPSVDKEETPKPKPKVPVRPKAEALSKESEKEKEKKKEEIPTDSEKPKNEVKDSEATKDGEGADGENGEKPAEADADEGSRWRKLYNKTAFTFQSSKDSAAAAAAAKKEAAAQKLKATQESIKASKDAATAAAIAKKEAAAAAVTAKKEAAAEAARLKKEAAAAKFWETGESIKSTTTSTTEYVKSSSSNAASSVNSSFWNVVTMAQKAAVDPMGVITGRAAEKITLLHYNDCCNVEGAGRFLAAVKEQKESNPLVLFSGNIFSPSMMSTATRGEQMVPVLNMLGTQCAVFGNHDFDHGLEVLGERMEATKFPWLLSNVIDTETNQPLGGAKVHHTVDWEGRKIGLVGLVEREWLDTVSTLDNDNIDYTDYVDAAAMLAEELKRKGCEFVVALTHMRTDNDVRLAEKVPEIDLILGGHNLVYEKRKVNGTYILKSGSDFRQFSTISLDFRESPVVVEIDCVEVDKEQEADTELAKCLEQFTDMEETRKDEVLCKLGCDLDGRFSSVRTAETNLGNFLSDVMLAALQADCAILNAGTVRSNVKHPKGEFKLRDLLSILPMIDSLVLVDIKGSQIHQALENGVSQWPKLDGRFPQVGGITFAFDPTKPPGSRIDPAYIKIGTEYMDSQTHYKLATKASLASGEEGYSALAQGNILVDHQCAPSLTSALINHFKSVKMKKILDDDESSVEVSVHQQPLVTKSCYHQDRDLNKRQNTAAKLRPKVESRILQLTAEIGAKLKEEKEQHKSGGKKKSKHRDSSPQDSAREALFDVPGKKNNGVSGKSKKSGEEAEDLK